MNVAKTYTVQPHILSGTIVQIDADLARGLHSFSIVGLAGRAVEESKDRISSAIKHSGFESPKTKNQKIVISLSPADLRKEGPLFDLPIAVAYLLAASEINVRKPYIYVGELGLDGSLREVRGILNVVLGARASGYHDIIVPQGNAKEASLIAGVNILPAQNLREVICHIDESRKDHCQLKTPQLTTIPDDYEESRVLLEDIKGQESAKRALTIAAAGRHNLILVGPPGTGKTMLARAFQNLLPPLSREEILEVTAIHSLVNPNHKITSAPPFRTPHHSASHTALVGGGTNPRPGEVTLAHKGVLFMDEFPEFERRSLDALRQPLEDHLVSIARIQGSVTFPADFILVAALNPYRGQEDGTQNLARALRETYADKISGPILDRIDLWVEVPHIPYETLTILKRNYGETTQRRKEIMKARDKQRIRLAGRGISTNGAMTSRDIDHCLTLVSEVKDLLNNSAKRLNLSPRSFHRLLKVTRTIADLDEAEVIETKHLLEALQYRVQSQ
jgi:magnesium chelatase family protein